MTQRALFPSAHLPDYLKRDLGIGSSSVHPFVAALDASALGWFHLSQELAYSLVPDFFDRESQRRMLTHLGFATESLTPPELSRLFEILGELFQRRSSLGAVSLLGSVYFGSCSVRRGRPHPRQKMTAARRFPLRVSDGTDRDRVVFVRLAAAASEIRVREFAQSARRLMPADFDVLVAMPVGHAPLPEGFRLIPFRIHERRL